MNLENNAKRNKSDTGGEVLCKSTCVRGLEQAIHRGIRLTEAASHQGKMEEGHCNR
jgi:hypothetical protein